MGQTVLVTGGSGFLGVHAVLQLLQNGYTVRTTVRSLSREADVRKMLRRGGVDAGDRLSFFAADLMKDEGWHEAARGCDYVLHVASPFPLASPKDENEVIVPAREGTLRVLRAARDEGVKRVVVTSSFAAIGYGHPESKVHFDEMDWSNPNAADVNAYVKSKTIAERAAWEWLASEGGGLEMAVVNPVGVFGPVLGPDLSGSVELLKGMLNGALPMCVDISFGLVDVRDTIDLHLRAMTHPEANGERFLAIAGEPVSIQQLSLMLKKHLGQKGDRLPTKRLPNWLVRTLAVFIPKMRAALPELGRRKRPTNAKAQTMLGWQPRPWEQAVLASAESLTHLGLLKA